MASSCEVCNQLPDPNHQGRFLDDFVSSKQTLRRRLETALGQTVTSDTGWLCTCCQFHLAQIEIYYSALGIFKEQYWNSVRVRKVQVDSVDITAGPSRRNMLLESTPQLTSELDSFLAGSGLDVISGGGLMPVETHEETVVKNKDWLFDKDFSSDGAHTEPMVGVRKTSHRIKANTEPTEQNTTELGQEIEKESDVDGPDDEEMYHEDTDEDEEKPTELKELQSGEFTETNLAQQDGTKKHKNAEAVAIEIESGTNIPEPDTDVKCSAEPKPGNPGDISMICPTCNENLSTRSELTTHMLTHGQKPHTCRLCGRVFASYLSLKTHKAGCKGSRFICSTCGQELQSLATLHCHMLIHSGKPHACHTCGQRFQQKSGLREHTKSHTGERPFVCDCCHKRFYTKILLKSHMINIHSALGVNGGPHVCEVCGKSFERMQTLWTHCKEHKTGISREDEFKCDICDKSFVKRQGLLMHVKVHKNDTMACVICGETLPSQFALKAHMGTHTGERPFTCRKCDKAYRQKQGLMDHMTCHHPEECDQKFTCKDCGKSFANLCRMKTHALIHRTDRPYLCNMCGNSFKLQKTLDTHMIVHTDERPWKCTECPSSFKNKPQLTLHIQRHFGNHSYPCRHCKMKFYTSTERKRHEMKHTGNYAHTCMVCSKPFREATSLKAHMHQHTGARPYQCQVCSEGFANWTSHKRHMVSAHGAQAGSAGKTVNLVQTGSGSTGNGDQTANVGGHEGYGQPHVEHPVFSPSSLWDPKHEAH